MHRTDPHPTPPSECPTPPGGGVVPSTYPGSTPLPAAAGSNYYALDANGFYRGYTYQGTDSNQHAGAVLATCFNQTLSTGTDPSTNNNYVILALNTSDSSSVCMFFSVDSSQNLYVGEDSTGAMNCMQFVTPSAGAPATTPPWQVSSWTASSTPTLPACPDVGVVSGVLQGSGYGFFDSVPGKTTLVVDSGSVATVKLFGWQYVANCILNSTFLTVTTVPVPTPPVTYQVYSVLYAVPLPTSEPSAPSFQYDCRLHGVGYDALRIADDTPATTCPADILNAGFIDQFVWINATPTSTPSATASSTPTGSCPAGKVCSGAVGRGAVNGVLLLVAAAGCLLL